MHGLCHFLPFKKAKNKISALDYEESYGFIIAVTGISIKSELAGVVHSWTYSCFEALKVRDYRLEPVPHCCSYDKIR